MYGRLRTVAAPAVLMLMIPHAVAAGPVPPPAPSPTASAASPDAPDPDPPLGGRDAAGSVVGGPRMIERGDVVPAGAVALPAGITAHAFVLADLDTGAVLAARDPHGRYQPASILKLLTVDTVLPHLPGGRTVTISAAAASTEGSHAGLLAGGRYTVDQLFGSLLLVSGNDSAVALAEADGGVATTVAQMNATALRLGAVDTFVQTPSGLDGWEQLTSAFDMALFLRAAVQLPRFLAYERLTSITLPAQHVGGVALDPVVLANQADQFAGGMPGLFAAKTGFTDAAQHTFAAATQRAGRRLGVVLLRAQRYPTDQWQQAESLLDWGYRLPATASVGQLVAPVAPAPPRASTTAPARAGATPAAVALPPGSRGSSSPWWWAAPGAMVIVLLATVRARLGRRRRG